MALPRRQSEHSGEEGREWTGEGRPASEARARGSERPGGPVVGGRLGGEVPGPMLRLKPHARFVTFAHL